MFLLPVGDENPTKSTPYINYLIIALNVVIFFGLVLGTNYEEIVKMFGFTPSKAVPYTYFTSLFLHGSVLHLFGNMLFLWIVGDNVEDKLGHFWYLLFYLFCGMFANFIHTLLIPANQMGLPTIGASGAISAVLGAYIVLFPRNKIIFFYFFWIVIFIKWGTFRLASLWAIGLWFVLQLFSQATNVGASTVAYGAHIGGFLAGVILLGILVMTGIIKAHWEKELDSLDIGQEERAWLRDGNKIGEPGNPYGTGHEGPSQFQQPRRMYPPQPGPHDAYGPFQTRPGPPGDYNRRLGRREMDRDDYW